MGGGYLSLAADYNGQSSVTGADISFDKMEVDHNDPTTITIGDDNTQTITIGSDSIDYGYALQTVPQSIAIGGGTYARNVTMTGKTITINGGTGKGAIIGFQNEKGSSMLLLKGERFVYNGGGFGDFAGVSNTVSGVTVAHGTFQAGDENAWMESFQVNGGLFSVGQSVGNDRTGLIYAKEVTLSNGARGQGQAFKGYGKTEIHADTITLTGNYDNARASGGKSSVMTVGQNSDTSFSAKNITIEVTSDNDYLYAIRTNSGSEDYKYTMNLDAENRLEINGNVDFHGNGDINWSGQTITVTGNMSAKSDTQGAAITVKDGTTLYIGSEEERSGEVTVTTDEGAYGILVGSTNDDGDDKGVLNTYVKRLTVNTEKGTAIASGEDMVATGEDGLWEANISTGHLDLDAGKNGLQAYIGTINVTSDAASGDDGRMTVNAKEHGVMAQGSLVVNQGERAEVTLTANGNGAVMADGEKAGITIEAGKSAVYARMNSTVTLTAEEEGIYLAGDTGAAVYAGIDERQPSKGDPVDYRAYANLSAKQDIVTVKSNGLSVLASGRGGSVDIEGAVQINAFSSGLAGASLLADTSHVALAAGGQSEEKDEELGKRIYGQVHLSLTGDKDSAITGDIVAARGGTVAISQDDYQGQLRITGDILAGNGGTKTDDSGEDVTVGRASVDLGSGTLFGRVDDYAHADEKRKLNVYDSSFVEENSSTEESGTSGQAAAGGKFTSQGTVDLTMGEGSQWFLTGQSWTTTLSGNGGAVVLAAEGYDFADAVHIGTLSGEHTFVMSLDRDDHGASDMLYIADADTAGRQLIERVQFDEIAGWENMADGEKLRFATVNADETVLKFESGTGTAVTYMRDRGVNDMAFVIDRRRSQL